MSGPISQIPIYIACTGATFTFYHLKYDIICYTQQYFHPIMDKIWWTYIQYLHTVTLDKHVATNTNNRSRADLLWKW
jgi:hypothetical protein